MGVGDPREMRPVEVKREEHAQHMLRLVNGQCVSGCRHHRLVWALVNGVMLEEAGGKGFAVQRVVLKRARAWMAGLRARTS